MKERNENELIGYEIKPGKQTLNPIDTLTRHVCLSCLQPTDKKIREIKRKEIHPHTHTSCDRCF